MSASREKRRRWELGISLKYERRLKDWYAERPPIILFRRWLKWKKNKPAKPVRMW